jgi:hypothetical protein
VKGMGQRICVHERHGGFIDHSSILSWEKICPLIEAFVNINLRVVVAIDDSVNIRLIDPQVLIYFDDGFLSDLDA